MENEKISVGRCPICGADVVKTGRGYKCVNAASQPATCTFQIPAMLFNRHIADSEAAALIGGEALLLDGFSSNEGKIFSSILSLDEARKPQLNARVGLCPACGGDIYVGLRGFNCSNFKRQEKPCTFTIWRFYGGHEVSLQEAREILEKGITSQSLRMFREDGGVYSKRLGLAPDKQSIIKF